MVAIPKAADLNYYYKEVNCTELFPSVRVPYIEHTLMDLLMLKIRDGKLVLPDCDEDESLMGLAPGPGSASLTKSSEGGSSGRQPVNKIIDYVDIN